MLTTYPDTARYLAKKFLKNTEKALAFSACLG